MSEGQSRRTRHFEPGETVFAEGSRGSEMYILVSGEVEIKKRADGGQRLLKVCNRRNDFFGEMSLVDDSPRSATAVASQPTELVPIDQRAFEHLILTNGTFALKIIRALSDRIRRSNTEISELIDTAPRDRFIFGMVDYAMNHGEKLYNKGYKISIDAMKAWVNEQIGMPEKEIDAYLYRLIRTNDTPFASTAKKTQDHIVLTEDFVARHNRRGRSGS
ncbi:MAG: Crp/Fnr family transcriptional regulator [Spirochaetota bacterium]